MKGKILLFAFLAVFLSACNEDLIDDDSSVAPIPVDMSDFFIPSVEEHEESITENGNLLRRNHSRNCQSVHVLNRQLKENPGLYKKLYEVESHSRAFINAKKGNGGGKPTGGGDGGTGGSDPVDDGLGLINIPVYVHVVHSRSQENISDAQIQSQIQVLNDDFRMQNADASDTPSAFAGLAADSEITFTLAGTFRHQSSRSDWGTNDAVKSAYPPITPATHLNIWVCNIGGSILGYAQFPGGSLATDGVVISPQFFGTTGYVSAPFDKGRTATHEVGHYLNLRHIWGDGRCNRDDFVADTPKSDRSNGGCPSYPTKHCRSADMTMNYMDYTDDACMTLFTVGQKARMRSIFAQGGARASMIGL